MEPLSRLQGCQGVHEGRALPSLPSLYLPMTFFRLSGVFLAVLLISACDKEPPTPPKAPTPAPPSVSAPVQPEPVAEPAKPEPAKAEAAAPAVSKPAAKTAPKAVTQEPKVQAPKAASVATAKAEEPAKTLVRPPQPPEKIQRLQVNKPQTAEQRKASEAVKKQKLEKPKLDLHLPRDVVKNLEPQGTGTAAPSSAPTLLPPMFAEKPTQQSSFEMGGRLITNEHSRDTEKDASYWDTVDGAELQFKFNH